MKIETGKRYVRLDGKVSGVITQRSCNSLYPFVDLSEGVTYTPEGKFYIDDCEPTEKDLIAEYVPESKQTLNFWEAREASKQGKSVRCVTTQQIYPPKQLLDHDYAWYSVHFEAEWEIVEEPKHITHYLNIYPFRIRSGQHTTKEQADHYAGSARLSCIAITVDENGKLIEARNV
jgi:hypothetical protein